VPGIAYDLKLGTVYVGSSTTKRFTVRNIGTGTLHVRVASGDTSMQGDAVSVAAASGGDIAVTVTHEGPPPARAEDKVIRGVLESNTPVAALRARPIEIRYRLEPMLIVPERLDFGGVTSVARTSARSKRGTGRSRWKSL
jgi:hypothetical protein